MAALAGRKVRVQIDTTNVAGATSDSITINREHIDATNKDDAGVRKLLGEIGLHSMSMSCSGVLVDDALAIWASDPAVVLKSMTFVVTGIGTFAGSFGLSSYEPGGDDGPNAATFSAAFESAGAISFTAAP